MLRVNGIHVYYDAIHALKGVTFSVEAGELVTLLGGNGAGKTTTLKTISGLLRPRRGNIELEGCALDEIDPHEIVRRGVAHVPEGRRVFLVLRYWRICKSADTADLQILQYRKTRKDSSALRHMSHPAPDDLVRVYLIQCAAFQFDVAAARPQQSGDGFQGGGLAGAVAT